MAETACPSCGYPRLDGHKFCPACGVALPESDRPAERSAEEVSRARIQDVIGPAFRVGALRGRGGFAEVFEAEDVHLRRRVAIKAIRPDLPVTPELVQRFQREARAIAAVRHPNIVEIYAVGARDSVAWFAMPLVAGESLGDLLAREGRVTPAEATRILTDAAHALESAHRAGIVHRDVKPDNILLEGADRRVLLTDFGIAKAVTEGDIALTASGLLVGTPSFMSPEQAAGDQIDHRSDIYSLGVVGYQMIAGRLPFEGGSIRGILARLLTQEPEPLWAVRPDCPEVLVSVIGRALAKDPGERWADFGEMLEVLEGRVAPPEVGRRAGVTGWDRMRGPGRRAGASDTPPGDASRRFRRSASAGAVGLLALGTCDAWFGLGGISAWVALAVVAALAARAARIWSAGDSCKEIFGLATPADSALGRSDRASSVTGEEDFGRHRSLVHTSVKSRAAILKALSTMPHQEQDRFPGLQEAVEQMSARVRHLVRRVLTLEERIGEVTIRLESLRTDPDRSADSQSVERARGRLGELTGARDGASEDLHRVVALLRELEESLSETWQDDPARARADVLRLLQAARTVAAA